MFDLRPVGYVVGLLVAALGLSMLVPMALDFSNGSPNWKVFAECAIVTTLVGGLITLSTANSMGGRLNIQQTFLLTTGVWVVLPVFGALPFFMADLGANDTRYVNAFFEAMSGLTTTGSTVFSHLETLPQGINLWRGILQWYGGIGIIVVAMVFLPELRVGGMQIFKSEGFDTMGKVLPRAAEIATQISWIYVSLTVLCALAYLGVGLEPFEAIMHALSTLSTGGFSSQDASFQSFTGPAEYVATLFMILASLPFARYAQMLAGTAQPFFRDTQIRAYLVTILSLVLLMSLYRVLQNGDGSEESFRGALFNITSIMSGTGYASENYEAWGPVAPLLFFFIGLIGGCAGSTSCSVKIFRYQILFASIAVQIRKIHLPHGLFSPRFEGRAVGADVLNSVMSFFVLFFVTMGVLAILLAMTGLDFTTAVSGAATSLGNIGPGLGPIIGPEGNFSSLNDTAKWLLSAGMLIGRLELLVVYAILTIGFWRS